MSGSTYCRCAACAGGEGLVEFFFELGAGLGNLDEQLFVFGQEAIDVTGAVVGAVRIF